MDFNGKCCICYGYWKEMEPHIGIVRNSHPECRTHLLCTPCYSGLKKKKELTKKAILCPMGDKRQFKLAVPTLEEVREVTAPCSAPASPARSSISFNDSSTSASSAGSPPPGPARTRSRNRRKDSKRRIQAMETRTAGADKYTCGFCGKVFTSSGTKSNHERRHQPAGFQCHECGYKTYRSYDLDRHMKTHQTRQ